MNTSLNAAAAVVAERSLEERRGRMPPQVPYIIGNEGCERFSFYGMRNILTAFLVSSVIPA